MAAAAILSNRKIAISQSPYRSNGLTDDREIWHDDAFWPSPSYRPLKFKSSENPRTPAILKIPKIAINISVTFWYISMTFGTVMHIVPTPRQRTAMILKTEKSWHLDNGLTDRSDIWHDNTFWPLHSNDHENYKVLNIQDSGRPPSWKSKNRNILVMVWAINMIWHSDAY